MAISGLVGVVFKTHFDWLVFVLNMKFYKYKLLNVLGLLVTEVVTRGVSLFMYRSLFEQDSGVSLTTMNIVVNHNPNRFPPYNILRIMYCKSGSGSSFTGEGVPYLIGEIHD